MLSNLMFSLNAVLPVFIVIAVVFAVRQLDIIDDHSIKRMSTLVFRVALPVMLFRDISRSRFNDFFDVKLLSIALITTLLTFFVAYALSHVVTEKSRGSFIQGCFRSNYAIIGLSVIGNILGEANTGKGAIVTTFVIPLYNILAVIVLTAYSLNKTKHERAFDFKMVLNILTNPMIIGIALGIPFSYFNIQLPEFVGLGINYLAGVATPLALIAIGGSIKFNTFVSKLTPALIVSAYKLIIVPLMFIPLALYLGQRGENLVVLFIMYASPTAVSSFVMADIMQNDAPLAANIVLLSTLLSAFTFTAGIFILRSFGFI